jgi:hypothetical protein
MYFQVEDKIAYLVADMFILGKICSHISVSVAYKVAGFCVTTLKRAASNKTKFREQVNDS